MQCSIAVPVGASLHAAAASLARSGAIVCLEPGIHLLGGRTLELPADVAATWRSTSLSSPAIISGGQPLDDWEPCADAPACPDGLSGVWMHSLREVSAAHVPVRQLWVGGQRASRRSLASASLNLSWPHGGFAFNGIPPGWLATAAADQVELRWPKVVKNWIEPRCVVTSVNASAKLLLLDDECYSQLEERGWRAGSAAFFENVAGPLAPGEFYSTASTLYFRPNATTAARTVEDGGGGGEGPPRGAVVPVQELLVNASGGHAFDGLGFAYSTYRQPSRRGGYVTAQSTVLAAPCAPPCRQEPVGAVAVARARNVSFTRCAFHHHGTPYALSIGNASQGVLVRNCTFSDLSGGALKLANVLDTARAEAREDPAVWDSDFLVERNVVDGAAREWRGAAAVFIGYVARLVLQRNSITNTGYTGISLGWGWGRVVSFARDNHVRANALSGVMQALNDGGCIYTLGPQPGGASTLKRGRAPRGAAPRPAPRRHCRPLRSPAVARSTVEGNVCRMDDAPVVGCFYHDNGSRYFTTRDNVADASPVGAPCVYLQGCCGAPALDIAVSSLWCRGVGAVRNGCAAENCTIDAASLHVVSGAWPAEAQAIIAAAGAAAP